MRNFGVDIYFMIQGVTLEELKDNKTLAIVEDKKDGRKVSSLSLALSDMQKIGLKDNGFTIQFASRFEDNTLIVDMTKSVLTTKHKEKSK